MGIDAQMFFKIKNKVFTEDELTRLSFALCGAIGAKKFFISDGLPPEEHRQKTEAWHAAFNAHPAYEEYRKADKGSGPLGMLTKEEQEKKSAARNKIVADIGEYKFEELRRAIEPTNQRYRKEQYDVGKVYFQDGPEILAEKDEMFYKISLWGRYYGIGYERGDILTYCAIAEWLEVNVPGCEVWYGGDSSGVLAKKFDDTYRKELRRHLYSDMGRDYFNYMSFSNDILGGGARRQPKHPAPCGLCIPREPHFNQYGTGNGGQYIAVHCSGCGKSFKSEDGGTTWTTEKEEL